MALGISALLQTRSTRLCDVCGSGDRVLVKSDLTGTMQLYELREGLHLEQLTSLPEPVGRAQYLPGGEAVVLEVDRGGDERFQLYRLDLGRERSAEALKDLVALTSDPAHVHVLAGISADGKSVAYASNRSNGVDFDLWLVNLEDGSERCLFAEGGWCRPASGFSPDGQWISVLRAGPRPLDTDLLLISASSGEARNVLAHPDEAALIGAPAWTSPDEFLFSANVGSDNAVIWRCHVPSGHTAPAGGCDPRWDTEVVASATAGTVCLIENRNGTSRLRVSGGEVRGEIEVPLDEPGVVQRHNIEPPQFASDGSKLYYTLTTPRQGGDVWAFDLSTGQSKRLTHSPALVAQADMVSPEAAEVASFDGELIPIFVFRPRGPVGAGEGGAGQSGAGQSGAQQGGAGESSVEGRRVARGAKPPVVVMVHGGPEGQSVLAFDPVVQGLVLAGYGVVVPNVRGSTGYGKRYAGLDDTTKRLSSVRDLASVHGALSGLGFDASRAALWGASYGGYMVLAGVAFQPELWAAGVDIVGISDLVTFLENTSPYRRSYREREYGSLTTDREFLASASPLRRAEAIKAPLFIIHGRNDPRVPVTEAEQLAAQLARRGIHCELLIYEDEGHGLARQANRLDAYPRAIAFLDAVLDG
ncbi:MAG TPA: prolyl oligopeptidase family serine peptidase [Acidimicrobiales bacterium]|nr:prolyl oligopeptidase family serine peptidase [Acidimicrobiales bacterium]